MADINDPAQDLSNQTGIPISARERTEHFVLKKLSDLEWDMLDADTLISQKPQPGAMAELFHATLEQKGVKSAIGFNSAPVNEADPAGESYLLLSASEAPKFFRFTMEKELKVHEPIPDWSTEFSPREHAVFHHFANTAPDIDNRAWSEVKPKIMDPLASADEKCRLDLYTKDWIDRGEYAEWSVPLTPWRVKVYSDVLQKHGIKDIATMESPEGSGADPEQRMLVVPKQEIEKFLTAQKGYANIRPPEAGEDRPESGRLEYWMNASDPAALKSEFEISLGENESPSKGRKERQARRRRSWHDKDMER